MPKFGIAKCLYIADKADADGRLLIDLEGENYEYLDKASAERAIAHLQTAFKLPAITVRGQSYDDDNNA